MTIKTIITHDGTMHADEVLAASVLKAVFPDAKLIRTRDQGTLEAGYENPETIIFDIGGIYAPDNGVYDHHMPNNEKPRRENGSAFSSFGLIWHHFGLRYLEGLGVSHPEATHSKIDADFVSVIDALDNGDMSPAALGQGAALSLPALINAFNPAFDAELDKNDARAPFNAAQKMASLVLSQTVKAVDAECRLQAVIEKAIADQAPNPILELPYACDNGPFLEKGNGADHVMFAVQPHPSGGYVVICARDDAQVYVNRMDLPESWGGLSGKDLEAETGIEGLTFCHPGLFIAGAKTKEAAIAMAQLALEPTNECTPC